MIMIMIMINLKNLKKYFLEVVYYKDIIYFDYILLYNKLTLL